ncbi:aldehyde dehydrogenase family 2 member C4-like isoform X2 [Cynara cardunculus var. scolymus]|uniref:aldehyde dehydrogenase family 2 member C4-like isoform X2 n=1 Tax=Cynara cardunculus var. scolymus TaxID=59895 RepID=UPI000D62D392|nr:aldehyde dehydrogenase family 2 member C4-like isoform X2 [Cynara cardunculus var. scolymus]
MVMADGSTSSENYKRIPNIGFTNLFINGDFVHSISGKTFETIDPSTKQVIANIAQGDKEDVDLAVKAARQAFDDGCWPRMPGYAGIPDGVLNVVTGLGHIAGAAVASHMDIDSVSFTGSTEVGRRIMQASATSNLKTVSLELGGKSPLIIFDDADVDQAADLALFGSLANKGEICVCSSRVFVQEGIYDELMKKLVEKAKTWIVGDPFDPSTCQGPQVDKKQYERVLSYIDHGKREGATLLIGGKPCGDEGYFIEPTIFENVADDSLIARDEIFGPVMAVMKFKTVEEVIKRGNATSYGLAAGIVTNDLNIANRVSRSIRAGIVWINCYHNFDSGCPIGGYKMSGFGKDHGMEALQKYIKTKAVVTPIYDSPWL